MPRTPWSLPAALAALLGSIPAQETPQKHDPGSPVECRRCQAAYARAMEHTVRRLRQASFPAKMIMGWLFLADGRHPRELEHVIDEAVRWRQRVGEEKAHNHRRNWYPALAGILLAEHEKYQPDRKVREALKGIVAHFVFVQEQTGGWFKWFEGAYKDRLDYPVKDLGILDAIVFGFLGSARALGLEVPQGTYDRAESCLLKLLSGAGISYGSGSQGGDPTGARGAFAMMGLLYAREDQHRVVRTYEGLLPRQIPKMDQGHHVGALHCLGVVLGCHLLGPKAYRQLTECWLDRLIDRQLEDGGIYVGDDEGSGGERKLLGEDDASTAAAALLILLQDPTRLAPAEKPRIHWLACDLAPQAPRFAGLGRLAAAGRLGAVLAALKPALAGMKDTPDEVRREAEAIRVEVEGHARSLLATAEGRLGEKDVLGAEEILEPLAGELGDHPLGQKAREALDRIRDDARLRRERAAQAALQKAWRLACRKGLRAARPALARVAAEHEGTAAAARAKEILE